MWYTVGYVMNGEKRRRHLSVVAAENLPASVGGLVDGAVGLGLASAEAVDVGVGLDQLDKVLVASEGGTDGGLDVVLSTAILGVEAVLLAVHATGDLDPAGGGVADNVGRLDEALGEDTGLGGTAHVSLGAEGNGAVLVGGNVTSVHRGEEQAEVLAVVDGTDLADLGGLGLGGSRGDGEDGQEGGGDEEGLGEEHGVVCCWVSGEGCVSV